MSFFDFLSSREIKVKNERLEAEISKVCEDLTNGIIELSEKAKKLNELKEKYNKTTSEIQASATPDENIKGTENNKSFFSNLFGSSNNGDAAPAAPPASPASPASTPDVSNTLPGKNMPAPDVNDKLSQESAMSAASTVQAEHPPVPEKPSSSFESLSEAASVADQPPNKPFSSNDGSSDIFSPPSDEVLQEGSLSLPASPPALVPASPPASPPAPVPNSLGAQQPAPGVEAGNNAVPDDDDSMKIGGKKKRSKRSKKTISNSHKKPRNLTKKKKNVSDNTTAQAQGLAQTLLQAHAQI